jgi:hypothetical protein
MLRRRNGGVVVVTGERSESKAVREARGWFYYGETQDAVVEARRGPVRRECGLASKITIVIRCTQSPSTQCPDITPPGAAASCKSADGPPSTFPIGPSGGGRIDLLRSALPLAPFARLLMPIASRVLSDSASGTSARQHRIVPENLASAELARPLRSLILVGRPGETGL